MNTDSFRTALVLLCMVVVASCLALCASYHTTGLANLASLLALCNYTVFSEDLSA